MHPKSNIDWEYVGGGVWEFSGLTSELEYLLLSELGSLTPDVRKSVLSHIASILDGYKGWVRVKPTIPLESERATTASLALADAVDAIENLGELSWSWIRDEYIDDFDDTIAGNLRYEDLPRIMSLLSEILADRAEFYKKGKGRPTDDGLDMAIRDLAILYEGATGQVAGFSSTPEKAPGRVGQTSYGPFVRFCENVLSIVSPTETSTVHNAIRKFVRQEKKYHQDN